MKWFKRLLLFQLFLVGLIIILRYFSIDFINNRNDELIDLLLLIGIPFTSLLMFWNSTMSIKNSILVNVGLLFLGFIILIAIRLMNVFFLTIFSFGQWKTMSICYQNNKDEAIKIEEQIWDKGAFGYGERRTVIVKPMAYFFYVQSEIDTNFMIQKEWKNMNIPGEIKFP
ncbi:MAG: hypothetical protein HYR91_07715 [Flavobacteriia bacterium]|nr:hypothetical protein [Flavobacteriia bacterium]